MGSICSRRLRRDSKAVWKPRQAPNMLVHITWSTLRGVKAPWKPLTARGLPAPTAGCSGYSGVTPSTQPGCSGYTGVTPSTQAWVPRVASQSAHGISVLPLLRCSYHYYLYPCGSPAARGGGQLGPAARCRADGNVSRGAPHRPAGTRAAVSGAWQQHAETVLQACDGGGRTNTPPAPQYVPRLPPLAWVPAV